MTYVVANWKLEGSIKFSKKYFRELGGFLETIPTRSRLETVICPPFPFLDRAYEIAQKCGFSLGGQDCSPYEKGPYTGDVSAFMLKEFGAKYVLVGHSECREKNPNECMYISQKIVCVQKQGLIPILCVGEPLDVREAGRAEAFVINQIEIALRHCRDLKRLLIAYEPVWAIGTGLSATLEDIESMHLAIKSINFLKGRRIPILYGGSVKPDNATEILSSEAVQGVLVGSAGLKMSTFVPILEAAL